MVHHHSSALQLIILAVYEQVHENEQPVSLVAPPTMLDKVIQIMEVRFSANISFVNDHLTNIHPEKSSPRHMDEVTFTQS